MNRQPITGDARTDRPSEVVRIAEACRSEPVMIAVAPRSRSVRVAAAAFVREGFFDDGEGRR